MANIPDHERRMMSENAYNKVANLYTWDDATAIFEKVPLKVVSLDRDVYVLRLKASCYCSVD